MPENRHSVIGEGTDVGLIGGLVVVNTSATADSGRRYPFEVRGPPKGPEAGLHIIRGADAWSRSEA